MTRNQTVVDEIQGLVGPLGPLVSSDEWFEVQEAFKRRLTPVALQQILQAMRDGRFDDQERDDAGLILAEALALPEQQSQATEYCAVLDNYATVPATRLPVLYCLGALPLERSVELVRRMVDSGELSEEEYVISASSLGQINTPGAVALLQAWQTIPPVESAALTREIEIAFHNMQS
jgi:hypothetical protein